MNKKAMLVFIACFLPGAGAISFSQNFQWARSFGSSGSVEYGMSVALDAGGNVFTAGTFAGGVDFDPGPAVYNINSQGGRRVYFQA